MKRKNPLMKSLYILAASVALVIISVFFLKPQFQKEKEQKDKSDLLWKDAKREKILEITVKAESPEKSYSLKRSAESKDWIVEGQKSFDADSSAVDGLISSLLGTKKEDKLAIEATRAGLDVPKIDLKLVYTNENDKRAEQGLQIGEDSPVDYQSYARWKDTNDIFMISKSLKFALDKKVNDFRNKKVLQLKLAEFKEINITGKKNYKLELGDGGKWWLFEGDRKLGVDAASVADWINSLSSTRVSTFAADDKTQLAKYGLNHPTVKLQFVDLKGDKQEWIASLVKVAKDNHVYLAGSKSETIYEMPATFIDEIQKEPSNFRNKRIASFDKAKAQKVVYTSPDLKIELVKSGDTWHGTHFYKGKKVEGKAVPALTDKMLNSLAIVRAVSFVEKSPKSPSLGLSDRKKIEIYENPAEPATVSFQIGNKINQNDTVIWGPKFEDPVASLLNYEELFPTDSTKIIVPEAAATDKNVANPTQVGASSAAGNPKMTKLEKSVNSPKEIKKLPAAIVEKGAKYSAVIIFKDGKKLKATLASDKAPYTVSNFIHLARNGFFDGVKFHRVIANFVAQGGDPTGTGSGGPGYMFDNEDNDLKHVRGSLSMAHAGRNTNGSQFFVVLAPQPHLDGLHTVFGQVTDGLDLIDQIKQGDVMQTVEIYQEK
jgi:peptidyl-prolyl cis-trans isomerase B (cyclophilin B)